MSCNLYLRGQQPYGSSAADTHGTGTLEKPAGFRSQDLCSVDLGVGGPLFCTQPDSNFNWLPWFQRIPSESNLGLHISPPGSPFLHFPIFSASRNSTLASHRFWFCPTVLGRPSCSILDTNLLGSFYHQHIFGHCIFLDLPPSLPSMEASWHTVHGVLFFQWSLSQRRNVPSWKVHRKNHQSIHQNGTRIAHRFHGKSWEMSVYVSFIHDKWWWMMMNAIEIKEHLQSLVWSCFLLCIAGCGCLSVISLLVIPGITPVGWLQLTQPEEHRRTRCVWFFPSYPSLIPDIHRYPRSFTGKTMTSEPPELHLCNPTVCRLVMSPSWKDEYWLNRLSQNGVLDGCERVWTWGYQLPPTKKPL